MSGQMFDNNNGKVDTNYGSIGGNTTVTTQLYVVM